MEEVKMADEQYRKLQEEDRQVLREIEIRALERDIEEATPEEKELRMIAGDRSFTLEEMLAEIKEGTEYGEMFLAMRKKSRLERLRRR
jgi:hypothetical protein